MAFGREMTKTAAKRQNQQEKFLRKDARTYCLRQAYGAPQRGFTGREVAVDFRGQEFFLDQRGVRVLERLEAGELQALRARFLGMLGLTGWGDEKKAEVARAFASREGKAQAQARRAETQGEGQG